MPIGRPSSRVVSRRGDGRCCSAPSFLLRSRPMGHRNPTRHELLEHVFPVRLEVAAPSGHADPVPRALRRVLGQGAHGLMGSRVYLATLAQASAFVCACPEAPLSPESNWPVRLTPCFEIAQEGLVRDALRVVVGDTGYVLAQAGHHRADRPAWHLGLRSVWDGVQFMRMAQPAQLVAERWRGRDG